MTPVRPLDLALLVATSALVGALIATYSSRWGLGKGHHGPPLASGTLGWLAMGCPLCNKIVVALLGVSGSLSYFAPVQPALGALGVALATSALWVRLRRLGGACRVDPAEATRR